MKSVVVLLWAAWPSCIDSDLKKPGLYDPASSRGDPDEKDHRNNAGSMLFLPRRKNKHRQEPTG